MEHNKAPPLPLPLLPPFLPTFSTTQSTHQHKDTNRYTQLPTFTHNPQQTHKPTQATTTTTTTSTHTDKQPEPLIPIQRTAATQAGTAAPPISSSVSVSVSDVVSSLSALSIEPHFLPVSAVSNTFNIVRQTSSSADTREKAYRHAQEGAMLPSRLSALISAEQVILMNESSLVSGLFAFDVPSPDDECHKRQAPSAEKPTPST